jgi:branched-chain amino acid aminotransferase
MASDNGFRSMACVDGVITPTADARIPVLDRGFLYGDSIYEVFRTYEGVPLLYHEHWARFGNSAALIRMANTLSLEALTQKIRATIAATGAADAGVDVYVRYALTRGEGPVDLYPSPALEPRLVIIVREVPHWNASFYTGGVKLAVVGTRRNPRKALDPNIKGGNYMNNVLGVIEARELGADDCVMLNAAGLVTEASNSNVFFVIDGELVTPGDDAGNLRGLTKMALHDACEANGLVSGERDIHVDELDRSTECFITSATREVMPVASLRLADGRTVDFPPGGGELTRRAGQYYRQFVRDYVAANRELALF